MLRAALASLLALASVWTGPVAQFRLTYITISLSLRACSRPSAVPGSPWGSTDSMIRRITKIHSLPGDRPPQAPRRRRRKKTAFWCLLVTI